MAERTIGRVIREVMDEPHGRMTPDRLWLVMTRRARSLMEDEARKLQTRALWDQWRRLASDDKSFLPGLEFQRELVLEGEDGKPYTISTTEATLPLLEEQLARKEENVASVTAERDKFRAFVEKVRPVMELAEGMTVAEAFRRLGITAA